MCITTEGSVSTPRVRIQVGDNSGMLLFCTVFSHSCMHIV